MTATVFSAGIFFFSIRYFMAVVKYHIPGYFLGVENPQTVKICSYLYRNWHMFHLLVKIKHTYAQVNMQWDLGFLFRW